MMNTLRPQDLRQRTKQFALGAIRLFQALPKNEEARILGRQFLRASTSVAANYRACGRARSKAEFVAKMGIVVEESDEALFWLELLGESHIVAEGALEAIKKEAAELVAIFSASRRTAQAGLRRDTAGNQKDALISRQGGLSDGRRTQG